MLTRRFLFVLSLFLLLSCRAHAIELCTIDAAMRKDDPRLSQRVTLTEARMPLGALLERLSEKTGVALRMDNSSGASGAMLVVVLHGQPLADTMNALYAFFGYRKAQWEWHRTLEAGKYAYFFAQTQASRELAAAWKQQAQQDFLNHAKVMMEIARMTSEERKRSAGKLDHSLLDCPDGIGKSWVTDEATWQGIRAFMDSVKPEDQNKVLMGSEITVPMENLSAEGKAFAIEQTSHVTMTIGGVPQSNKPTSLTFKTTWGSDHAAPAFFAGSISEIGANALGRGVSLRQGNQWLLEGDTKTSAAETYLITAPDKPYPQPKTAEELKRIAKRSLPAKDFIAFRLLQMFHEIPQNLIAHLPEDQWFDIGDAYDKTAGKFLAVACKSANIFLNRKWRGDTLLVEYTTWYLPEEQEKNIPYATWKPFAQAFANYKETDLMPLPVIAKTITALSEAQWKYLLIDVPCLRPMATLSGLFGLSVRYPAMLTEKGVMITPEVADALRHTKPNSYSKPYAVKDGAQSLRIHQWAVLNPETELHIFFEVQDKKNVWHLVNGFIMRDGLYGY